MCSEKIDLELCAFEAAFPFLKVSLAADELEREIATFRAELLPQASDTSEIDEINQRLAAAVHCAPHSDDDAAG